MQKYVVVTNMSASGQDWTTHRTLRTARKIREKKGSKYHIFNMVEIGKDGIPYWKKVE